MKILYVEDNYSVLKEILPEIFGNIVSPEESERLKEIIADDYYSEKEIKELFKDSPYLTVEYDFLDALKLIESEDVGQYDYFVLDRDLGTKEKGLTPDDIRKSYPFFSDREFDYIRNNGAYGREGDYLLKRLHVKLNDKLRSKVFFLSAFPSKDISSQNEILRDIVGTGIFTKENYIDKLDKVGKKRLKDILNPEDEDSQIYKKWGRVLAYYDKSEIGPDARRSIVEALKVNALVGSRDQSYTDTIYLYDRLITEIKKYYEKLFGSVIQKQNAALYKFKEEKGFWDLDWNEQVKLENDWYTTAIIPRNIIEVSRVIRKCRNACEHNDVPDVNVDMSGLTVLVCAYALLEITRFWQDNNMDEKKPDSAKPADTAAADTTGE